MKLVTLMLLLSSVSLFGQNDSLTISKELGIRAGFINSFIPLDNLIGGTNPYLFHYKKTTGNSKFTRQSLNLGFNGFKNDTETKVATSSNNISIGYRVGWGKLKTLHKNLILHYGIDIAAGLSFSSSETAESFPGFNDGRSSTEKSGNIAFGPMVALQYNFSKHFGIYTEATFYYAGHYSVNDNKFDNSAQNDNTDVSTSYNNRYTLPTSLVIFYKF